jgi:anti-anti-sigma factor
MTNLTVDLTEESSNIWILKLIGGVDKETHHLIWTTYTSADLLQRLVAAKAKKLIIDLTAVDRFDSQGFRLLLNAHKEFSREKIEIVLKNPNPHLRRLFQIMQFDRVFTVEV